MKAFRSVLLSLAAITLSELALAQLVRPPVQPDYSFDSSTTLASRVQPPTATVLQLFHEAGMSPTEHPLSEDEQKKIAAAFDALPPLHQRVLKGHLRGIHFLDNMPNTALTSTLNPDQDHRLFDITFRAEILNQDVSEWLTWKEFTCFDTTGSPLRVAIQAGHLSAFQYVLLHEATHVVDGSLGITPRNPFPQNQRIPDSLSTAFIAGVWANHTVVAAPYRGSLLDSLVYRRGGKPQPIGQARRIYQALQQSPFASLYGSSSWNEDLAEYVTIFHFTQKLKQPFTITIRKGNQKLFSYKPMQSALVRKRFLLMKRFYTA